MKKDYTYIGAVLDRSGSMGQQGKIAEARNSFNNFIEEQKLLPGKADVYLTIFDDQIDHLYNGNINDCVHLNTYNFSPRGMTSLYDAIGMTVNNMGSFIDKMNEDDKPEKVIVLIITDGMENNSKEFKPETLTSLIEEQKNKYSWEFVFMGTTENAIKDAKSFGIVNTFSYDDSLVGTRNAYFAMSSATSSYRSSGTVKFDENTDGDSNENYK